MPLLQGSHAGDAAGKDLAGIGYVAGKYLNVRAREFKRVLLSLFLGCHKRAKEGTLDFFGKKKVNILRACEGLLLFVLS